MEQKKTNNNSLKMMSVLPKKMMYVLPKKNDACTIQTSFMFYRVFNSRQGISDYVDCPIPHVLLYTTGISSVKKTKNLQK